MPTDIEWVTNPDGTKGETWNPVSGCDKVSTGCKHCYAERMAKRLAGRAGYPGAPNQFRVTLHPEKLEEPLHWRKPRMVFAGSMTDLFHEDIEVLDPEFLRDVFAVMALCQDHTFQVLTKRAHRLPLVLTDEFADSVEWRANILAGENGWCWPEMKWPLPNVWIGVTVENQDQVEKRIPPLLQAPAAIRFISVEPMLGPIDLDFDSDICHCGDFVSNHRFTNHSPVPMIDSFLFYLDWVICGGETGTGARPIRPEWVRGLRNQCVEAHGTPFFFKSWGGLNHGGWITGKKLYQGSKIDGVEWKQYPG